MIKKSRKGEYIFTLQENASLPELKKKFEETLSDKAKVIPLTRETSVVVRNIPDFTKEMEIKEAFLKEIGEVAEISCNLREAPYSGTMTAARKIL